MAGNELSRIVQSNDFIAHVNILVDHLEAILYSNTLFNEDVIDVLERLQELDLQVIIQDLEKGAYLGNRKLDINLLWNIQGASMDMTEEELEAIWLNENIVPRYNKADIIFTDGTIYTLNFMFDGSPITISTHGDLLAQFYGDEGFLDKLEGTLMNTFPAPVTGEIVRAYDIIGQASNIERIILNAVSGEFRNVNPQYWWLDTTSALIVLATRAGELINLAISLPQLEAIYANIVQLVELQKRIPQLVDTYNEQGLPNGDQTIYNCLDELMEVYNNLDSIRDAVQAAIDAAASAAEAAGYAEEIRNKLDVYATTSQYGIVRLATNEDIDINDGVNAGGVGRIPDAYQLGQRLYIANQLAGTNVYGKARIATWGEVVSGTEQDEVAFVTPYTLRAWNTGGGGGTGSAIYGRTAGLISKIEKIEDGRNEVTIWGTLPLTAASPVRVSLTGNIIGTDISVVGSVKSLSTYTNVVVVSYDDTTGVAGQNYIDIGLWDTVTKSFVAGNIVVTIKAVVDDGLLPTRPTASEFKVSSPRSGVIIIEEA